MLVSFEQVLEVAVGIQVTPQSASGEVRIQEKVRPDDIRILCAVVLPES